MPTRALRGAVLIVASVASVLSLAAPAAATHHLQTFQMHSGRIGVGGLDLDTPGTGIPGCPPAETTLTTTLDDVAGTATVSFDSTLPFVIVMAPNQLEISGSGHGTYNPVTRQANVTLSLTVAVRAVAAAPDCTPGALRCSGAAHMNVTVQLPAGSPPVPAGGAVHASSTTGQILFFTPLCPFPYNLFVRPGAALSLSANPNVTPPQPGAHLTPV